MQLTIEIIKDVALYVMPIAAFVLSVLAYLKSKECTKVKLELDDVQKKVNEYELKLKQYECERIEKERNQKREGNIEARIINISKGKYKIRVWNSGNERAYNVDYNIPSEFHIEMSKFITPYEYLDAGKSFEENVAVSMESERKFKIITSWEDEKGQKFTKDMIENI